MGTFVTGDTGPDLTATIHLLDGDPDADQKDLTSATVKFQMRKPPNKSYTVNGDAVVSDADNGGVTYTWAPNDLNVKGEYMGRWEVTFPGGKIITTREKTITVDRQ